MGAGIHGGFGNTLGSTYSDSNSTKETYSDRGIDIPENLKSALSKMKCKGDYITVDAESFSMKDVSIMSKESGVEFAKIIVEGRTYIIRGDKTGVAIPDNLLSKMKSGSGKLIFHSHPHNDDCIPSRYDMDLMKMLKSSTVQQVSTIVTPNGKTSTFNEYGVVSTGSVQNKIDDNLKKIYLEMFGGN